MSAGETYWWLSPDFGLPLNSTKHAPFIEHYERVRTATAWKNLGFAVEVKTERPRSRKGVYEFRRVYTLHPAEREALATGKRVVRHFYTLLDYVRVGVPFDEFVEHPASYRDFCLARIADDEGRLDDALDCYRRAFEADPAEVRFAEGFFSTRILLGDATAPSDELTYFTNDADSLVHTDRHAAWVKLLVSKAKEPEAARLLIRLAELLEAEIAGTLPRGRYSGQSPSYAAHKRDQLRRQIDKWSAMRKYFPLMREIEQLGGLPPARALS